MYKLMMKKYYLYLIIFFIYSGYIFYNVGLPSLNQEIDIQAFSDSLTYENYAKDLPQDISIVSASSNLLGPILILKIFNYNYTAIFIFNCIIFFISVKLLLKYYDLNYSKLFIFIIINPLILFSLFGVNKEILLFMVSVLLLIYIKNRSITLFIAILILSFFIRWQLTIFVILIFFLNIIIDKFNYRKILLFLCIVLLSIIYPVLSSVFIKVIEHSNAGGMLDTGSGIYGMLNNLQMTYGGYIITFIPKSIQLMYGQLFRIEEITNLQGGYFWNNFVILVNVLSLFAVSLYILVQKKCRLSNDIFYYSLYYIVLFTLTPVYNNRYLFLVYIFFIVLASEKKLLKKNN